MFDICSPFHSAGVGRTGCFIAASIGSRQIQASEQVLLLFSVCHFFPPAGHTSPLPPSQENVVISMYRKLCVQRDCDSVSTSWALTFLLLF